MRPDAVRQAASPLGKNVAEQATITSGELTCEQCRELLSDYVDRELTDAERSSVERHLGNCAKCGTESVRLLGLKKIVQHWGGVQGSGEFRKSLMEKMIRESHQMPAVQIPDAADGVAAAERQTSLQDADAERTLPPIWILMAATVGAVAAYFLVRWLRGT
jgi:anti-sigma factor RsiW